MEITPRSKTIDNLGIDTYIRYAQDQQYLEKDLIKESKFIPSQATIEVSTPSFSSEYEILFQTYLKNKGWALFLPPKGYKDQKNLLFSYQLIPSLGGEENYSILRERIGEKLKKDKEKKDKKKEGKKSDVDEEISLLDEEKEGKKLTAFLDLMSQLDKILIDLNAKRSQYKKG